MLIVDKVEIQDMSMCVAVPFMTLSLYTNTSHSFIYIYIYIFPRTLSGSVLLTFGVIVFLFFIYFKLIFFIFY